MTDTYGALDAGAEFPGFDDLDSDISAVEQDDAPITGAHIAEYDEADTDDVVDAEIVGDEAADVAAEVVSVVEAKAPRPKRSAKRAARGGSKAELTQVAEKTLEILDENSEIRAALASLLGVEDSVAAIAVAVVTNKDAGLSILNDLNEVSHADIFEAAVVAASLGRARMRAAWRVLTDIGAADGSNLNASEAKAGLSIARVVKNLDESRSAILRGAYVALTN